MNHTYSAKKNSPRIMVINPNTNVMVTSQIRQLISEISPTDVSIEVTNPLSGPSAVESEEDKRTATQQVLSLIQQRQTDAFAGYIMACFDDIAIAEIRASMRCPAISLAEAGMRSAAMTGGKFTVVTTFEDAVPTIKALSQHYGLEHQCHVVATGIGVTDTAAQTQCAEQKLHTAITTALQQDSKAIVLGSGAFAGRAQALSKYYRMDIKDGLKEALEYVLTPTPVRLY